MFMEKQHSLCLIYAILSQIKLCRDYGLFGGHLWLKFDGRGYKNILKDREICPHPLTIGGNGWEVPKLSWSFKSYRD